MKNRHGIIFMIMNRILFDDLKSKSNNPDLDIRSQNAFQWGENLPSKECLGNIEQYLCSQCSNTQRGDGPTAGGNPPISPSIEHSATGECQDHLRDVTIQMDTFELPEPPSEDSSTSTRESGIPASISEDTFGFAKPEDILDKLRNVHIFISWIILSLSLPATST